MSRISLLDCTLRDGGYITKWKFKQDMIVETIKELIESNLDLIEVGYLNKDASGEDTTQFRDIESISRVLPKQKKGKLIIAMADVAQFNIDNITPYSGKSIDGIRVVFYKHQVEEALALCKKISEMGYKLFIQPMVTIDYSVNEYAKLISRVSNFNTYAVSIVDSFGYMMKEDFRKYFRILDNILDPTVQIGFHSHNNMNLAFITAQDIFEYDTSRRMIIDASLYGMGRGAGNLQTELIANYYNMLFGEKYNLSCILKLISKYIMPIYKKSYWGYSPYFLLTGMFKCHPNYASYLLEEYNVSVSDFEKFIQMVPEEMKTKCKKPYVLELYHMLSKAKLDGKKQ